MNATDILKDLASRAFDSARTLGRVTPDELNAHPGHDNSIAWLLWHAAREMDEQVNALAGGSSVWTSQGYDQRFGLRLAPHDMGYGHTRSQARTVVVNDIDLLLDHLRAVTEAVTAYITELTDDDLDVVIDETWDPPVTRGVRLVSVAADALEHVGQAAYVLGMLRAR